MPLAPAPAACPPASEMARLALDLTQGITEFSSRIALKMMFAQFGEVSACWIPPLDNRGKEPAYVKFNRPEAAQSALDACNGGQIYLDGVRVTAEWRSAPARTQDSRDFDAKGSNLMTARELMVEAGGRERDRDRHRNKSGRRRSRSRTRARRRSRKRSRSRSRSSSGCGVDGSGRVPTQ